MRGEPYGPQPHYWSDEWWEFYEHYIAEHERLGLIHWFGDWCDYALESYSGGAVYRKQFTLTAAQLDPRIVLDLGQVQISAEVEINGKVVGVGLARPYSFDITDYVHEGENDLKVTVFNSLANHYSVTYPSTYVFEGQTVSGLLGPVELQFVTKVQITAVACD